MDYKELDEELDEEYEYLYEELEEESEDIKDFEERFEYRIRRIYEKYGDYSGEDFSRILEIELGNS